MFFVDKVEGEMIYGRMVGPCGRAPLRRANAVPRQPALAVLELEDVDRVHGQYASDCGRSSLISNHGAFDPTKMCSVGRIVGSSASEPIATWT